MKNLFCSKSIKRLLSCLIVLGMLVCVLPTMVYAAETTDNVKSIISASDFTSANYADPAREFQKQFYNSYGHSYGDYNKRKEYVMFFNASTDIKYDGAAHSIVWDEMNKYGLPGYTADSIAYGTDPSSGSDQEKALSTAWTTAPVPGYYVNSWTSAGVLSKFRGIKRNVMMSARSASNTDYELSKYKYINFVLYSNKATNDTINVTLGNTEGTTHTKKFTSTDAFSINWEGKWKTISVPVEKFGSESGTTYDITDSSQNAANYFILTNANPSVDTTLYIHEVFMSTALPEGGEVPSEPVFTVEFYADGKLIDSQEVKKGGAATEPQAPEIEGFIFDGWDVSFENVQSNLTVNAIYIEDNEPVFTVDFYADGKLIDSQEVKKGESATEPQPLEIEGYIFNGWDISFENVQSNLIVNAIYIDSNEYNPEELFIANFSNGENANNFKVTQSGSNPEYSATGNIVDFDGKKAFKIEMTEGKLVDDKQDVMKFTMQSKKPMDLSGYANGYLNIRVYSTEATGKKFAVLLNADTTRSSGSGYTDYRTEKDRLLTMDWVGWKTISLPLNTSSADNGLTPTYYNDAPAGGWYSDVNNLLIINGGYSTYEDTTPAQTLYIDSIWLSKEQQLEQAVSLLGVKSNSLITKDMKDLTYENVFVTEKDYTFYFQNRFEQSNADNAQKDGSFIILKNRQAVTSGYTLTADGSKLIVRFDKNLDSDSVYEIVFKKGMQAVHGETILNDITLTIHTQKDSTVVQSILTQVGTRQIYGISQLNEGDSVDVVCNLTGDNIGVMFITCVYDKDTNEMLKQFVCSELRPDGKYSNQFTFADEYKNCYINSFLWTLENGAPTVFANSMRIE